MFPLALALAVPACSSDDSSAGGGSDVYTPAGNGVPTSEAAACQAILKADDARRAALQCGPVTRPPCPTYISKGHPACSQYDQGTVDACVAYIAGLASCGELDKKKCVVKALDGTAPNGCSVLDSGSDAGVDATPDSESDAEADATPDAAPDAESDSAADSAPDADDAAADAAQD